MFGWKCKNANATLASRPPLTPHKNYTSLAADQEWATIVVITVPAAQ